MRGPDRRRSDDVADPSLTEKRSQRLDLQVMATMMADERLDAGLAHLGRQGGRCLDRIGDRLLDQDMNAAPGAFDTLLCMKLIGRRDNHRLGSCVVEQLAIVRVHACRGMLGDDRIGIDVRNPCELIVAALGKLREVFSTDQSRADHAYGDFLHLKLSVSRFGRWLRGDGPLSTFPASRDQAGAGLPGRPQ